MKNTEKKPSQNRPHFNDKFNGNRNEKSRFPRDKQEVKETRIKQLSLSRAPSNKNTEQPKVQVTIKKVRVRFIKRKKRKLVRFLLVRLKKIKKKPCGRNEGLR